MLNDPPACALAHLCCAHNPFARSLTPDGLAEASGIRVGMRLLELNGEACIGKTKAEIIKVISSNDILSMHFAPFDDREKRTSQGELIAPRRKLWACTGLTLFLTRAAAPSVALPCRVSLQA